MIAKCLNCNRDYEEETQGAICPHDVGGPNKFPPWPKLSQPFPETWERYKKWCEEKGRHALHGDLWEGFLAGSRPTFEYGAAACVVCGDPTIYACSDCGIDSGGDKSVHVCTKRDCQNIHEKLHPDQFI